MVKLSVKLVLLAATVACVSCRQAVQYEEELHALPAPGVEALPLTFLAEHPLGDPETFTRMSPEKKVRAAYEHAALWKKPITARELETFFGHKGSRSRPNRVTWVFHRAGIFFSATLPSDDSSDDEPVVDVYVGTLYR